MSDLSDLVERSKEVFDTTEPPAALVECWRWVDEQVERLRSDMRQTAERAARLMNPHLPRGTGTDADGVVLAVLDELLQRETSADAYARAGNIARILRLRLRRCEMVAVAGSLLGSNDIVALESERREEYARSSARAQMAVARAADALGIPLRGGPEK